MSRALITSLSNPKLRLVRRLRSRAQRERTGLFVAEGDDLVDAARAAGIEPVELLVAGETASEEVLAFVSALPHPARAIAVFRRSDLPAFEERAVALALWHVSDPGNVGTLVRSADAFDAAVALSAGCADPTGPRALRASAGAAFRVPIGAFEEPSGRRIALLAHGATPLRDVELASPVVFVLGSEREGLPGSIAGACDATATIETPGRVESLNVAAAGAIALFEWARRAGG